MTENNKDSNKNFDSKSSARTDLDFQVLNLEQEKIIDWLENLKFRKQFIGGIEEQDVWKKINQLNEMYEAALKAERIRYDILLQEQKKKYESNPNIDALRKESSSYE